MIYLASQSPRRKTLLKEAGIKFRVIPSTYIERPNVGVAGPVRVARAHAKGKALQAVTNAKRGIILGSDTLIKFKDKIIGKPKNRADAKDILGQFSNNTHEVITAVFLKCIEKPQNICFHVRSKVKFKKLSESQIDCYLDMDEYRDKAGAYGYQSEGRFLVRGVRGSRSNVIGLPIKELNQQLRRLIVNQ